METTRIAEIPIEDLIGCTWEGVLERLTSDMDPWDIDLAILARRYRDYMQALRELEFEVPGRMVLTCSILLRMKSDVLLAMERPTDRDGLIEELEDAIDAEMDSWALPSDSDEFYLPVLRRPRRQVTILDLRNALTAAMKVSRRRAERLIEQVEFGDDIDPFENYEIGGTGFTDRLRGLFEKIVDLLSGHRVLSFFKLLDRGDKEDRVEKFFQILHLTAEGQIACSQEEFLGDIQIQLSAEQ